MQEFLSALTVRPISMGTIPLSSDDSLHGKYQETDRAEGPRTWEGQRIKEGRKKIKVPWGSYDELLSN